ncbi:peptidase inhibitor family I36 protein [Luteipulveratus halotolerans]|uniref:Cell surface protein n=1 Tax=Luteipulveratus halotolerans TaxID=1631356 RepID=A0A0L6CKV1_9MICO|nr:peptidase inhibitor family I36 protein [Luteipulveratus halotolerans]KNX38265.1 cell surface protein [Luteipulveratus halotolerans]
MSTIRIRSTAFTLAAAGVLAAGVTALAVPSAHAAARDGVCDTGEFCLYYNSDQAGSVSDFDGSVSDYGASQPGCYEFKSAGAGQGLCVKNNAASVWNRTGAVVTVFYKSGYAGAIDSISAGTKANLKSTLKNENAGHRFGSASRSSLSDGPYKATGTVSAYFDGYLSTSGRHEGVDMTRAIGAPVYAMVSGTVTRVTQGARGGDGLSTIAIYNATLDRTVVYLHSDPVALSVGQSIAKGQQIAVEDWRGISSSGAAHTHVEVRIGRQTAAAVSVGDPTLTNPNPTTFWEARGYNICCA